MRALASLLVALTQSAYSPVVRTLHGRRHLITAFARYVRSLTNSRTKFENSERVVNALARRVVRFNMISLSYFERCAYFTHFVFTDSLAG